MEPKPPTILIVEDHLATRRFLADNLSADGFEPLEADSARDGLRLMGGRPPDLAIIDLGLPDRDGLDLLREVRAGDETVSRLDPRVPVILLTGRAGELDRVRGFERGCDDYVVKPFSYPELRARIGAVLAPRPAAVGVGKAAGRGRSSSIRSAGRSSSTVSRSICQRRSSRCCGRWPRTRRACSRARSCCEGCGATAPWARPGPSIRTRRACARSWAGRGGVRGQCVGRRLPADRWRDRVSGAAALAGWLAAGVLATMWLLGRRALHARMEVVARACHELRGPLGAVRLGLDLGSHGGALSALQLRAIDSELARATLALEDLAGAREGHAAPRRLGSLDLRELLADSVQAWRPSAQAAGAELRLRWTGTSTPVRGDRLRLAQATGNLIANAIEHGGQVVEVRGCAPPAEPGSRSWTTARAFPPRSPSWHAGLVTGTAGTEGDWRSPRTSPPPTAEDWPPLRLSGRAPGARSPRAGRSPDGPRAADLDSAAARTRAAGPRSRQAHPADGTAADPQERSQNAALQPIVQGSRTLARPRLPPPIASADGHFAPRRAQNDGSVG